MTVDAVGGTGIALSTEERTESMKVQSSRHWHAEPLGEVFQALQGTERGLSEHDAAQRLQDFGPNLLPEKGAPPLWKIVLRQLCSPLIYVLVGAAVVSVAAGDLKDASFIGVVLALNALLGAYQEWQAEHSSHALRKLLRIHTAVERDNDVREVKAEEVVPGDVVWLESGNRVPADLRLLSSQGLEIDESLLTGESLAVTKDANYCSVPETVLADRRNMAFAGALVSRGRAKGIVVATGTATAVGQLALDVLATSGGKPPLIVRMENFSNKVAVGTLATALVIGGLGIVLWDYTLKETFFFVIALAVAAIPEGLPVAMTVALAVATTRMAKRNVIVRRLTAVEGLGSCTLIATDKTGTLTCNELTVREIHLPKGELLQVTGAGFAPHGEVITTDNQVVPTGHVALEQLVRGVVLCNEAELHQRNGGWSWRGDAVDVAFLCLGRKRELERELVLDQCPQVNAIPFESERQFAATYHRDGEGTVGNVKGAPERVLSMCSPLDDADRIRWEEAALNMAGRGLRVLAVARGELAHALTPEEVAPSPDRLRLLGLVGMIDPLRAGAREAVGDCRNAGVRVAMVTGDLRVTALAIARELGLADRDDQVVTADELEGKSAAELSEMVRRTRVFARVTPRQKLQIVEAARQSGDYVAVTGDGVNDAPALHAANIGVAMGKAGTDVARESRRVGHYRRQLRVHR